MNKSFLLFLLSVIVDHAPPEIVDSSLQHLHVPGGGGEHPDEDADHEGQDHEGNHGGEQGKEDTIVLLLATFSVASSFLLA